MTGKTGKQAISAAEHRMIMHALGGTGDRNHYAADPDGAPAAIWKRLVARGLAERGRMIGQHSRHPLQMFHVTEAGIAAARTGAPDQSPGSAAPERGAE